MGKTCNWGPVIEADYKRLWAAAQIRPECQRHYARLALAILANRSRYDALSKVTGVPWWFIAALHNMECGLSFNKHLHNGDLLTGRTTRVPAGRPVAAPASGKLPYTFEESAVDALRHLGLHKVTDWSLWHALYLFEGFNGYGYRLYHPDVNSPYLWSFTTVYQAGKYVADGKFSKTTVSQQAGVAGILLALKVFDKAGNYLLK